MAEMSNHLDVVSGMLHAAFTFKFRQSFSERFFTDTLALRILLIV